MVKVAKDGKSATVSVPPSNPKGGEPAPRDRQSEAAEAIAKVAGLRAAIDAVLGLASTDDSLIACAITFASAARSARERAEEAEAAALNAKRIEAEKAWASLPPMLRDHFGSLDAFLAASKLDGKGGRRPAWMTGGGKGE